VFEELTAISGDCDDSDPYEHPNQTWYEDADSDDYSTGTTDTTSCTRPVGYRVLEELTAISGDCDDGDAAINPGATEVCNDATDNDCDGTTDTFTVPGDFSTIQAAINGVSDGCTVLVSDGTYTENIDFSGKAITVISENGAGNTTINGGGSGSVVTFNTTEGAGSVLDGFTITNGAGKDVSNDLYGGGIYCSSASPTITNCIFSGNDAEFGGGIYCGSSSPTITNCTFIGNTAGAAGDSANGGDGAGLACEVGSAPTITDCSFISNVARDWGGGISCNNSSPTITKCIVVDNSAFDGGGISCRTSSSPTITNCTIADNISNEIGGAKGDGGGVFCKSSSSPTITNCTISNNDTPGYGGGIAALTSSSPTVLNSIFWGDTATTGGNEIYIDGTSSIGVTYTDVEGGYAGTGNDNSDPLFVDDTDANVLLRDYHLSVVTSPCVDTGTSAGAPADDIDDDTRDANPDMGSDEF
jgi:parallel beta-helix repeat protein